MANNWYVITGGPSTGKTTLVNKLAELGYAVIPEAARILIDEAIASGMTLEEFRADEKRFQYDVARLKEKTENGLNRNERVFFDRGMQDTAAYLRYYDFEHDDWLKNIMQKSSYQKVFVLEPLEKFVKDYVRIEDNDFNLAFHPMLLDAYREYGIDTISVPDIGINNRLQFILDSIESGEK